MQTGRYVLLGTWTWAFRIRYSTGLANVFRWQWRTFGTLPHTESLMRRKRRRYRVTPNRMSLTWQSGESSIRSKHWKRVGYISKVGSWNEIGSEHTLKTVSFRVRKPLFFPLRPTQAGGRGCFPVEHIREVKQGLFSWKSTLFKNRRKRFSQKYF